MKSVILTILIVCSFSARITAANSQPDSSNIPHSSAAALLQTRDNWRSVRTNNLFVVGNAGEEDLRQVAVWLEFFHSAFGQLVSRTALDSSVPTTVIVFRDNASFVPFKPLYQGRPANVAGYFVPGQDTNYIALSIEGGGRDPFSTAFHEYVHLHLQNSVPGVPLWLNEGLAEFYGALSQANGEAVLGAPIPQYIRFLRGQQLLPLTTLFAINHDSPHYNEQDKSGVFYAESWALVHYLMMGDNGRRQQQFKRFLNLAAGGDSPAKAFQDAFGLSLETVEQDFTEYIRRGEFPSQRVNLGGSGPSGYIAMQRTSVSEGEAHFYLGDLLLHINRDTDAEKLFKRAIALDPGFNPTYASLGLLLARQKRNAEAKPYLQRAVASSQNYLVHYAYAYVLSREGTTPSGSINEYSAANAQIMRDELRQAIKLAPDFPDSYYLLALVNLVMNSQLDEAVTLVRKAERLAPDRDAYDLLLAQIYLRQNQTDSARQILEPLARQNTNATLRSEAKALLESADQPADANNKAQSAQVTSNAAGLEQTASSSSGLISSGSMSGVAIRDGRTIDNSGPMPSVDAVIDSYVQAVGGVNALKAMNNTVAKGSVDVVGASRDGKIEIYFLAPNKRLTVLSAHPFGEMKMGYDGKRDWKSGNVRAMNTTELSAFNLYNPLTLRSSYSKITLLGKSKIGFREVYLLELQPPTGAPEKMYLDAESSLPVRINSGNVETYLDDWSEVDGIKVPFSINRTSPGLSLKIRIKECLHNLELNGSMFEKPVK